ncbi:MAG TPA: glycosyltransferase [Microlunatus sp.]
MTPSCSLPDGAPVGGAVIIPAHNEEAVIGRTLAGLASLGRSAAVDVLVVCNGCTDATADIARGYSGVTVIEAEAASKPAALNAGDRATPLWPRLYLDADIGIVPAAVEAVFRALSGPNAPLAARPESMVDTAGSSFPVRAYYRARARIPESGVRLWGAGGYAVSRAGHERFAAFPEITADDSYFDGLFIDDEKTIVATVPMRVHAPRTTSTLLRILARHRRGQLELQLPAEESRRRVRALVKGVRGPRSAVDAFCYAALTALARMRTRGTVGLGTTTWETDASTRAASTAPPASATNATAAEAPSHTANVRCD